MKRMATVILTLISINLFFVNESTARGRSGSHRVGGTNSHGKGSHYVGGYGGGYSSGVSGYGSGGGFSSGVSGYSSGGAGSIGRKGSRRVGGYGSSGAGDNVEQSQFDRTESDCELKISQMNQIQKGEVVRASGIIVPDPLKPDNFLHCSMVFNAIR